MQWYYATDGQRLGPVPHFELERLVRSGTVKGDSLLWRQGMTNWQTLDDVRAADPSLISITQSPPPVDKTWADAETNAGVNRHGDDIATSRRDNSFGERGNPGATDTQTDFAAGTYRKADESTDGVKRFEPESLVFAGFWSRVAAFLIDGIIVFFVWNIISNLIATIYYPEAARLILQLSQPGFKMTPEDMRVLLPFYGIVMGLGFGWAILYDTFFILKYSATPGKLLLGLQIVRADGAPLGFGRIVARCIAKTISGMTFGIGYLVVLVDEQKRGLHDFFCSTRVIKKRR